MIVAAEETKFVLNLSNDEQNDILTDFLTRMIGPHLANLFINKGEPVSSTSLYQMGAVNYLAPIERLQEDTKRLATKLATAPEQAFSMLKQLLDQPLITSLEDLLKQEHMEQTTNSVNTGHDDGEYSG